MSPAWNSRMPNPSEISRQYRSHAVGSRNFTTVSAGSRRSSMFQCRTARQSTTGTFLIGIGAIDVGAVPFKSRATSDAACFACSS